MSNEIKQLRKELEELRTENQAVQAENQAIRAENDKLRNQVGHLMRILFGKKSEKIDPRQLLLSLDIEESTVELDDEAECSAPELTQPRKKQRRLKERIPENLPVRTEYIDPPEVQDNPDDYKCIGEETHTELSLIPGVYFIKKTVRRKYVKKDNRELAPIIVPAQPRLIENSFASNELLIDIVLRKYTEHMPLYRQAQSLKQRYGIDINYKTMSNWIWHIGNWLRIIYDEMRTEIRQSCYMQADETFVEYIEPGNKKTKLGYLWSYHTPNVAVVFEWHKGRGVDAAQSMLGEYTGDLQTDGYQVYRTLNAAKEEGSRYRMHACWAHARRKFFNAQSDSDTAKAVLSLIQKLYKVEAELREKGANHDERKEGRKQSIKNLAEIKKLLKSELTNHLPQSPTGKAISYTLGLWDELERYAHTGHIEIDNNLIENTIRPTAIGKKNWLFFGSPNSGQTSAIIYSVIETCRKLEINPYEYLNDVLPQLPVIPAAEAKELTPRKWLQKRERIPA